MDLNSPDSRTEKKSAYKIDNIKLTNKREILFGKVLGIPYETSAKNQQLLQDMIILKFFKQKIIMQTYAIRKDSILKAM